MDAMVLPGVAFWAMFALYVLGIVLALAFRRPRATIMAAAFCASGGGLAAFVAGLGVLLGAPSPGALLDTHLPFGGLSVQLDPLSAFFLVVIGLLSVPVAVYSVGYLTHTKGVGPRRL